MLAGMSDSTIKAKTGCTWERWLSGVDLTIRTAMRGKSMRITWPDQTSVEVYFTDKGAVKSQVSIQHRKLRDQAAAIGMKRYWEERLAALQHVLVPAPGKAWPRPGG
jgi:hypothetical protein